MIITNKQQDDEGAETQTAQCTITILHTSSSGLLALHIRPTPPGINVKIPSHMEVALQKWTRAKPMQVFYSINLIKLDNCQILKAFASIKPDQLKLDDAHN